MTSAPRPSQWPAVAVIIPARNEAGSIGEVIGALAADVYPGQKRVFLINDNSDDATVELARAAANRLDLTIIDGAALEPGWSGKLWAIHQGVNAAKSAMGDFEFVLFLDADIVLDTDTLGRLVARAQSQHLALASLMARLDMRGFWGAALMPAFIYFFQKLYPFPLSNDPDENVAGAAGGVMLIRRSALEAIGGIASVKETLIDDCALARRIKNISTTTKIWIGLARADEAVSRRDNRSAKSIWDMVSRTAFTQLNHSLILVGLSIVGMALIYLAPPLITVSYFAHRDLSAVCFASSAWGLMSLTYWPTLKHYEQQPWQSATLPFAALLYMAMTLSSAWAHQAGRGGAWKGRTY